MVLKKNELTNIVGGAVTATMFNAIVKGFMFIFDLGKSVGSSISRIINKNYC